MASPLIELRTMSIRFAEDTVLHEISLTVQKGETFVIIGPSGHGKSVLLKAMAGILEPSSGQMAVEGKSLHDLNEADQIAVQRRMGMLFQKNALFDSLTCADNIAFPLRETTDLTENIIQERVAAFLEAVGLGHARNLYPSEISGGMQKRLGIARALALRPEIVLYDDPTAGLDPITSRRIIDLIQRLKSEYGSTVIAVTNDMNRAYQMASRIGMIFEGRLIYTGSPEEIRACTDRRVQQFIRGEVNGPLTELQ